MRVTICEMNDEAGLFARDWEQLAAHVRAAGSELVLLPEMPFSPWFARARSFDAVTWRAAIAAHNEWLARLPELAPAAVLASRPIEAGGRRLNEAFGWDLAAGYRALHTKRYLPNDEGFGEASWYDRGDGSFEPAWIGGACLGCLLCTELWFTERARTYGRQGIHLLACPRATGRATVDKWLVGGRAAAVVSGAYCLSSNRVNPAGSPVEFGGSGWICDPDGEVLAVTARERPFVTLDLDLRVAEAAKHTYPRDVEE